MLPASLPIAIDGTNLLPNLLDINEIILFIRNIAKYINDINIFDLNKSVNKLINVENNKSYFFDEVGLSNLGSVKYYYEKNLEIKLSNKYKLYEIFIVIKSLLSSIINNDRIDKEISEPLMYHFFKSGIL